MPGAFGPTAYRVVQLDKRLLSDLKIYACLGKILFDIALYQRYKVYLQQKLLSMKGGEEPGLLTSSSYSSYKLMRCEARHSVKTNKFVKVCLTASKDTGGRRSNPEQYGEHALVTMSTSTFREKLLRPWTLQIAAAWLTGLIM